MQDRVSETGATGGAIPTSGGHSIQYLLELASTLGNIDSLEKIIVIISNIVKAISEDAASVGVPFDTSHPFYKTVMEEIGGLKDAATYYLSAEFGRYRQNLHEKGINLRSVARLSRHNSTVSYRGYPFSSTIPHRENRGVRRRQIFGLRRCT